MTTSTVDKVKEYVGVITPTIFKELKALNIGSMTSEKASAITSGAIGQILQTASALALEEDLKKQQVVLAQKQVELTEQRIISERAQTEDTVDGNDVKGLLGMQRKSLHNQAKGFKVESLRKVMDTNARVIQVSMSSNEGGRTEDNRLDDDSIGATTDKLNAAIDEYL